MNHDGFSIIIFQELSPYFSSVNEHTRTSFYRTVFTRKTCTISAGMAVDYLAIPAMQNQSDSGKQIIFH